MSNEKIDVAKMSDKQLIENYYKFTNPKTFSMIMAGACAGELITNRGYVLIEEDEGKFVKKVA